MQVLRAHQVGKREDKQFRENTLRGGQAKGGRGGEEAVTSSGKAAAEAATTTTGEVTEEYQDTHVIQTPTKQGTSHQRPTLKTLQVRAWGKIDRSQQSVVKT